MALMVSGELRLFFLIVTGDDFPDANEDLVRALAEAWYVAGHRLKDDLGPELRRTVQTIKSTFSGQAEQAFAAGMAPFVGGRENYIDAAGDFFRQVGKLLEEIALDVEYMKYVVVLELAILLAEMKWAAVTQFFFGPLSLVWFSGRLAFVRETILGVVNWVKSRLWLFYRLSRFWRTFLVGMAISMGNQMAVTVGAQTLQFLKEDKYKRHEWNKKYISDAAVVGVFGGIMAPIAHEFGQGLVKLLDRAFTAAHGARDWHKAFAHHLSHIASESVHEGMTATVSMAALNGQLASWADFTAGAASGVARVSGHLLGVVLTKLTVAAMVAALVPSRTPARPHSGFEGHGGLGGGGPYHGGLGGGGEPKGGPPYGGVPQGGAPGVNGGTGASPDGHQSWEKEEPRYPPVPVPQGYGRGPLGSNGGTGGFGPVDPTSAARAAVPPALGQASTVDEQVAGAALPPAEPEAGPPAVSGSDGGHDNIPRKADGEQAEPSPGGARGEHPGLSADARHPDSDSGLSGVRELPDLNQTPEGDAGPSGPAERQDVPDGKTDPDADGRMDSDTRSLPDSVSSRWSRTASVTWSLPADSEAWSVSAESDAWSVSAESDAGSVSAGSDAPSRTTEPHEPSREPHESFAPVEPVPAASRKTADMLPVTPAAETADGITPASTDASGRSPVNPAVRLSSVAGVPGTGAKRGGAPEAIKPGAGRARPARTDRTANPLVAKASAPEMVAGPQRARQGEAALASASAGAQTKGTARQETRGAKGRVQEPVPSLAEQPGNDPWWSEKRVREVAAALREQGPLDEDRARRASEIVNQVHRRSVLRERALYDDVVVIVAQKLSVFGNGYAPQLARILSESLGSGWEGVPAPGMPQAEGLKGGAPSALPASERPEPLARAARSWPVWRPATVRGEAAYARDRLAVLDERQREQLVRKARVLALTYGSPLALGELRDAVNWVIAHTWHSTPGNEQAKDAAALTKSGELAGSLGVSWDENRIRAELTAAGQAEVGARSWQGARDAVRAHHSARMLARKGYPGAQVVRLVAALAEDADVQEVAKALATVLDTARRPPGVRLERAARLPVWRPVVLRAEAALAEQRLASGVPDERHRREVVRRARALVSASADPELLVDREGGDLRDAAFWVVAVAWHDTPGDEVAKDAGALRRAGEVAAAFGAAWKRDGFLAFARSAGTPTEIGEARWNAVSQAVRLYHDENVGRDKGYSVDDVVLAVARMAKEGSLGVDGIQAITEGVTRALGTSRSPGIRRPGARPTGDKVAALLRSFPGWTRRPVTSKTEHPRREWNEAGLAREAGAAGRRLSELPGGFRGETWLRLRAETLAVIQVRMGLPALEETGHHDDVQFVVADVAHRQGIEAALQTVEDIAAGLKMGWTEGDFAGLLAEAEGEEFSDELLERVRAEVLAYHDPEKLDAMELSTEDMVRTVAYVIDVDGRRVSAHQAAKGIAEALGTKWTVRGLREALVKANRHDIDPEPMTKALAAVYAFHDEDKVTALNLTMTDLVRLAAYISDGENGTGDPALTAEVLASILGTNWSAPDLSPRIDEAWRKNIHPALLDRAYVAVHKRFDSRKLVKMRRSVADMIRLVAVVSGERADLDPRRIAEGMGKSLGVLLPAGLPPRSIRQHATTVTVPLSDPASEEKNLPFRASDRGAFAFQQAYRAKLARSDPRAKTIPAPGFTSAQRVGSGRSGLDEIYRRLRHPGVGRHPSAMIFEFIPDSEGKNPPTPGRVLNVIPQRWTVVGEGTGNEDVHVDFAVTDSSGVLLLDDELVRLDGLGDLYAIGIATDSSVVIGNTDYRGGRSASAAPSSQAAAKDPETEWARSDLDHQVSRARAALAELKKTEPRRAQGLTSLAEAIVDTTHDKSKLRTGMVRALVEILADHLRRDAAVNVDAFEFSRSVASSLGTALPGTSWLPAHLRVGRTASTIAAALEQTRWTSSRLKVQAAFARSLLSDAELQEDPGVGARIAARHDLDALQEAHLDNAVFDVLRYARKETPGDKDAFVLKVSAWLADDLGTRMTPSAARRRLRVAPELAAIPEEMRNLAREAAERRGARLARYYEIEDVVRVAASYALEFRIDVDHVVAAMASSPVWTKLRVTREGDRAAHKLRRLPGVDRNALMAWAIPVVLDFADAYLLTQDSRLYLAVLNLIIEMLAGPEPTGWKLAEARRLMAEIAKDLGLGWTENGLRTAQAQASRPTSLPDPMWTAAASAVRRVHDDRKLTARRILSLDVIQVVYSVRVSEIGRMANSGLERSVARAIARALHTEVAPGSELDSFEDVARFADHIRRETPRLIQDEALLADAGKIVEQTFQVKELGRRQRTDLAVVVAHKKASTYDVKVLREYSASIATRLRIPHPGYGGRTDRVQGGAGPKTWAKPLARAARSWPVWRPATVRGEAAYANGQLAVLGEAGRRTLSRKAGVFVLMFNSPSALGDLRDAVTSLVAHTWYRTEGDQAAKDAAAANKSEEIAEAMGSRWDRTTLVAEAKQALSPAEIGEGPWRAAQTALRWHHDEEAGRRKGVSGFSLARVAATLARDGDVHEVTRAIVRGLGTARRPKASAVRLARAARSWPVLRPAVFRGEAAYAESRLAVLAEPRRQESLRKGRAFVSLFGDREALRDLHDATISMVAYTWHSTEGDEAVKNAAALSRAGDLVTVLMGRTGFPGLLPYVKLGLAITHGPITFEQRAAFIDRSGSGVPDRLHGFEDHVDWVLARTLHEHRGDDGNVTAAGIEAMLDTSAELAAQVDTTWREADLAEGAMTAWTQEIDAGLLDRTHEVVPSDFDESRLASAGRSLPDLIRIVAVLASLTPDDLITVGQISRRVATSLNAVRSPGRRRRRIRRRQADMVATSLNLTEEDLQALATVRLRLFRERSTAAPSDLKEALPSDVVSDQGAYEFQEAQTRTLAVLYGARPGWPGIRVGGFPPHRVQPDSGDARTNMTEIRVSPDFVGSGREAVDQVVDKLRAPETGLAPRAILFEFDPEGGPARVLNVIPSAGTAGARFSVVGASGAPLSKAQEEGLEGLQRIYAVAITTDGRLLIGGRSYPGAGQDASRIPLSSTSSAPATTAASAAPVPEGVPPVPAKEVATPAQAASSSGGFASEWKRRGYDKRLVRATATLRRVAQEDAEALRALGSAIVGTTVDTSALTDSQEHQVRDLVAYRMILAIPGRFDGVYFFAEKLARDLGIALPPGSWLPAHLMVERGRANSIGGALTATKWTAARITVEAEFARDRLPAPEPQLPGAGARLTMVHRRHQPIALDDSDSYLSVLHILASAEHFTVGTEGEKRAIAEKVSAHLADALDTTWTPGALRLLDHEASRSGELNQDMVRRARAAAEEHRETLQRKHYDVEKAVRVAAYLEGVTEDHVSPEDVILAMVESPVWTPERLAARVPRVQEHLAALPGPAREAIIATEQEIAFSESNPLELVTRGLSPALFSVISEVLLGKGSPEERVEEARMLAAEIAADLGLRWTREDFGRALRAALAVVMELPEGTRRRAGDAVRSIYDDRELAREGFTAPAVSLVVAYAATLGRFPEESVAGAIAVAMNVAKDGWKPAAGAGFRDAERAEYLGKVSPWTPGRLSVERQRSRAWLPFLLDPDDPFVLRASDLIVTTQNPIVLHAFGAVDAAVEILADMLYSFPGTDPEKEQAAWNLATAMADDVGSRWTPAMVRRMVPTAPRLEDIGEDVKRRGLARARHHEADLRDRHYEVDHVVRVAALLEEFADATTAERVVEAIAASPGWTPRRVTDRVRIPSGPPITPRGREQAHEIIARYHDPKEIERLQRHSGVPGLAAGIDELIARVLAEPRREPEANREEAELLAQEMAADLGTGRRRGSGPAMMVREGGPAPGTGRGGREGGRGAARESRPAPETRRAATEGVAATDAIAGMATAPVWTEERIGQAREPVVAALEARPVPEREKIFQLAKQMVAARLNPFDVKERGLGDVVLVTAGVLLTDGDIQENIEDAWAVLAEIAEELNLGWTAQKVAAVLTEAASTAAAEPEDDEKDAAEKRTANAVIEVHDLDALREALEEHDVGLSGLLTVIRGAAALLGGPFEEHVSEAIAVGLGTADEDWQSKIGAGIVPDAEEDSGEDSEGESSEQSESEQDAGAPVEPADPLDIGAWTPDLVIAASEFAVDALPWLRDPGHPVVVRARRTFALTHDLVGASGMAARVLAIIGYLHHATSGSEAEKSAAARDAAIRIADDLGWRWTPSAVRRILRDLPASDVTDPDLERAVEPHRRELERKHYVVDDVLRMLAHLRERFPGTGAEDVIAGLVESPLWTEARVVAEYDRSIMLAERQHVDREEYREEAFEIVLSHISTFAFRTGTRRHGVHEFARLVLDELGAPGDARENRAAAWALMAEISEDLHLGWNRELFDEAREIAAGEDYESDPAAWHRAQKAVRPGHDTDELGEARIPRRAVAEVVAFVAGQFGGRFENAIAEAIGTGLGTMPRPGRGSASQGDIRRAAASLPRSLPRQFDDGPAVEAGDIVTETIEQETSDSAEDEGREEEQEETAVVSPVSAILGDRSVPMSERVRNAALSAGPSTPGESARASALLKAALEDLRTGEGVELRYFPGIALEKEAVKVIAHVLHSVKQEAGTTGPVQEEEARIAGYRTARDILTGLHVQHSIPGRVLGGAEEGSLSSMDIDDPEETGQSPSDVEMGLTIPGDSGEPVIARAYPVVREAQKFVLDRAAGRLPDHAVPITDLITDVDDLREVIEVQRGFSGGSPLYEVGPGTAFRGPQVAGGRETGVEGIAIWAESQAPDDEDSAVPTVVVMGYRNDSPRGRARLLGHDGDRTVVYDLRTETWTDDLSELGSYDMLFAIPVDQAGNHAVLTVEHENRLDELLEGQDGQPVSRDDLVRELPDVVRLRRTIATHREIDADAEDIDEYLPFRVGSGPGAMTQVVAHVAVAVERSTDGKPADAMVVVYSGGDGVGWNVFSRYGRVIVRNGLTGEEVHDWEARIGPADTVYAIPRQGDLAKLAALPAFGPALSVSARFALENETELVQSLGNRAGWTPDTTSVARMITDVPGLPEGLRRQQRHHRPQAPDAPLPFQPRTLVRRTAGSIRRPGEVSDAVRELVRSSGVVSSAAVIGYRQGVPQGRMWTYLRDANGARWYREDGTGAGVQVPQEDWADEVEAADTVFASAVDEYHGLVNPGYPLADETARAIALYAPGARSTRDRFTRLVTDLEGLGPVLAEVGEEAPFHELELIGFGAAMPTLIGWIAEGKEGRYAVVHAYPQRGVRGQAWLVRKRAGRVEMWPGKGAPSAARADVVEPGGRIYAAVISADNERVTVGSLFPNRVGALLAVVPPRVKIPLRVLANWVTDIDPGVLANVLDRLARSRGGTLDTTLIPLPQWLLAGSHAHLPGIFDTLREEGEGAVGLLFGYRSGNGFVSIVAEHDGRLVQSTMDKRLIPAWEFGDFDYSYATVMSADGRSLLDLSPSPSDTGSGGTPASREELWTLRQDEEVLARLTSAVSSVDWSRVRVLTEALRLRGGVGLHDVLTLLPAGARARVRAELPDVFDLSGTERGRLPHPVTDRLMRGGDGSWAVVVTSGGGAGQVWKVVDEDGDPVLRNAGGDKVHPDEFPDTGELQVVAYTQDDRYIGTGFLATNDIAALTRDRPPGVPIGKGALLQRVRDVPGLSAAFGGGSGDRTVFPPESFGRGLPALADVVDRLKKGGNEAKADVVGYTRRGQGRLWRFVVHGDGDAATVSIVDPVTGDRVTTPEAFADLTEVYAAPSVDGVYINSVFPHADHTAALIHRHGPGRKLDSLTEMTRAIGDVADLPTVLKLHSEADVALNHPEERNTGKFRVQVPLPAYTPAYVGGPAGAVQEFNGRMGAGGRGATARMTTYRRGETAKTWIFANLGPQDGTGNDEIVLVEPSGRRVPIPPGLQNFERYYLTVLDRNLAWVGRDYPFPDRDAAKLLDRVSDVGGLISLPMALGVLRDVEGIEAALTAVSQDNGREKKIWVPKLAGRGEGSRDAVFRGIRGLLEEDPDATVAVIHYPPGAPVAPGRAWISTRQSTVDASSGEPAGDLRNLPADGTYYLSAVTGDGAEAEIDVGDDAESAADSEVEAGEARVHLVRIPEPAGGLVQTVLADLWRAAHAKAGKRSGDDSGDDSGYDSELGSDAGSGHAPDTGSEPGAGRRTDLETATGEIRRSAAAVREQMPEILGNEGLMRDARSIAGRALRLNLLDDDLAEDVIVLVAAKRSSRNRDDTLLYAANVLGAGLDAVNPAWRDGTGLIGGSPQASGGLGEGRDSGRSGDEERPEPAEGPLWTRILGLAVGEDPVRITGEELDAALELVARAEAERLGDGSFARDAFWSTGRGKTAVRMVALLRRSDAAAAVSMAGAMAGELLAERQRTRWWTRVAEPGMERSAGSFTRDELRAAEDLILRVELRRTGRERPGLVGFVRSPSGRKAVRLIAHLRRTGDEGAAVTGAGILVDDLLVDPHAAERPPAPLWKLMLEVADRLARDPAISGEELRAGHRLIRAAEAGRTGGRPLRPDVLGTPLGRGLVRIVAHTLRTRGESEAAVLARAVVAGVAGPLLRAPRRLSPAQLALIDARFEYARRAQEFESSLAHYVMTRRADVEEVFERFLSTVWQRRAVRDLPFTLAEVTSQAGAVGTGYATNAEVVRSGNLRERITLLWFLAREKEWLEEMPALGEYHPDVTKERDDRRNTAAYDAYLAAWSEPGLDQAERNRKLKELLKPLLIGLAPDEVRPPLSEREEQYSVSRRGLAWQPADRRREMPMSADLQRSAEGTGALVSTGSSGSAYLLVHFAQLANEVWNAGLDLSLVRLGLAGYLIATGQHTYHDVMRVLTALDPTLAYADDLRRYWALAPLTEEELRERVAADGRFPHEHAYDAVDWDSIEEDPVEPVSAVWTSRLLRDEAGKPGSATEEEHQRAGSLVREAVDDMRAFEGSGPWSWWPRFEKDVLHVVARTLHDEQERGAAKTAHDRAEEVARDIVAGLFDEQSTAKGRDEGPGAGGPLSGAVPPVRGAEPGESTVEDGDGRTGHYREYLRGGGSLSDSSEPGEPFPHPEDFVFLVGGSPAGDSVDVGTGDLAGGREALAVYSTWRGEPRDADTVFVDAPSPIPRLLGHAPELAGSGGRGLAKVAARLTEHGAHAFLLDYRQDGDTTGRRPGRALNLVRHRTRTYLVDGVAGTWRPVTPKTVEEVGAALGLGHLYAIVTGADGDFVTLHPPRGRIEPGGKISRYDLIEYAHLAREQQLRMAAAAGDDIPLPGLSGRLVQWLGGLRLVTASAVTPEFAADLSTSMWRDVIALVVGADAEDQPRWLLFSPGGHPLPVRVEDLPPETRALF